VRFCPTEVHTENHFGPVLRFGTAGAGLDIDIRVVGVHLTREHPPKFERRKTFFETVKIANDFGNGIAVVLLLGERQKIARVREACAKFVKRNDNLPERRTFLAKRLSFVGFVPDIGLLEFTLDLGQSLSLAFVVKGTPSTHSCVQ